MKTRTRRRLPGGRLSKQEREQQLIDTLDQMITTNGFSPTLRELATAMELSLTRIAQLMESCQEQGLISGSSGIARTWRVIR